VFSTFPSHHPICDFFGDKISQPGDKKDGLATKYKGFFFSAKNAGPMSSYYEEKAI
jgi:hypothetical protein